MARWPKPFSKRGSTLVLVGLGGFYIGFALLESTDGSLVERSVDVGFFAGAGLLLLYGGYRLRNARVHPAVHPRIATWCLGGFVLMLGLALFVVVSPTVDVDEPLWAVGIATAVGSIGGLGIGVNQARAMSRARALQQRNRELRRYETLFEESLNVNAVLDLEGRFTYLTPSVRYVLGYEPDDLVGELAFEYMHPADREAAMAGFYEAVEEGRSGEPVEFRFEHADGSWVVLEGRGRNLTDDPEIEGIVAYTHDVTERKERELELSEYKTVAETATDVIVTIDEESEIQSVNPAVEAVFGYEREAVVGKSLTMLMPSAYRGPHDAAVERYLATSERQVDWEYVEFPGLHAEGHEVPLAISFSEHEHQGEQFFTGIIRDNTERKRLEENLRQERDLREQIVETSPVGIAVIDSAETVTFLNDRGEALFGRSRAQLNELDDLDSLFELPGSVDARSRGELPTGDVLAGGDPIYAVDRRLTRPDGTQVWLSLNAAPIGTGIDDPGRAVLAFEDVTERKRTRDRLVRLNEFSRSLADAETNDAVADLVVEAARATVPLPLVTVAFYDEREGRLRPASKTEAVEGVTENWATDLIDRTVVWQAFVDQTDVVVSDLTDRSDVDETDTPLRSLLIFPLGDHGLLVAAATRSDAFSDTDQSLASMLVAATRSALDRVTRERSIRERKDALAEKNAVLERLQRINDTIRGITTELIQASTRAEIVQAVCTELTRAEAYSFAWIGTEDAVTDEVTPEAWDGAEDGYLDAVRVHAEPGESGEPTGAAAQASETIVRNHLAANPPFEAWRQAALERGYQAVIAVPLTYQGTTHGVLSLYATRSDVFDPMEQAVVTELGETIGYALNAIHRKRALVSDTSVELEFELRRGKPPFFEFAAEHDCGFVFETVVQRGDGRPGIFFTIRGIPAADVLTFGEQSAEIEEITLVSEDEEGALFECRLHDSAFFSALLDRGAMPQTLTACGYEGHAGIRIPLRSDVRTFVELFAAQYEDCELVGRREVDEPVMTRQAFKAEFRTRITERQREILHTAYVSGFFDWPRDITAQELATVLDVSQPTVSRHIRSGERELFGLLFDE